MSYSIKQDMYRKSPVDLGLGLSYSVHYGSCLYGEALIHPSMGLSHSHPHGTSLSSTLSLSLQRPINTRRLFRVGYLEIFPQIWVKGICCHFKGNYFVVGKSYILLKIQTLEHLHLPLWTCLTASQYFKSCPSRGVLKVTNTDLGVHIWNASSFIIWA